jgi:hypothetical protein
MDVYSQLNRPDIARFLGTRVNLGPQPAPCIVCPNFKDGNAETHLHNIPNTDRMRQVGIICT